LVVTGLPADRAATLLNEVDRHLGHGRDPAPGSTVELPHRPPLEVVELPHPEAHLFVATVRHGERPRSMQLVWPDDRGRSPWHPVFRGRRGGQPVLGPRAPAS
jgi:hypothetical protein